MKSLMDGLGVITKGRHSGKPYCGLMDKGVLGLGGKVHKWSQCTCDVLHSPQRTHSNDLFHSQAVWLESWVKHSHLPWPQGTKQVIYTDEYKDVDIHIDALHRCLYTMSISIYLSIFLFIYLSIYLSHTKGQLAARDCKDHCTSKGKSSFFGHADRAARKRCA